MSASQLTAHEIETTAWQSLVRSPQCWSLSS
jgi:hypothetical protein